MIFLTVGTTKFHFNRLLKAVDEVLTGFEKPESLMVQKGTSDYRFKYKKKDVFGEISFENMVSSMKKARVIICHGGPATIFLALKHGRNKPLVVPRSKEFGEHVDNHEVYFAQFLKRRGEAEAVLPQEDLLLKIAKYLRRPKRHQRKKRIVASSKLIEKLTDYTHEE